MGRHHAFPMDFDCLQGSCRKCEVEVSLEGESANVLACQEQALDGMRVMLDVAPDATVSRLREQEAKERAQKQMMSRRTVKTKDKAEDTRKRSPIFDYRERLPEVITMQALMDSDRKPPEMLTELQTLLDNFDGKEFTNAVEFCKLDEWVKRQSWGREKQRAAKLRRYLNERIINEQSCAPEVETMAC